MILVSIFFIFYVFFGFFSIYFCIVTPHTEIQNSSMPVKILYWHGICFLVAFITSAVLTFSLIGAQLILDNFYIAR